MFITLRWICLTFWIVKILPNSHSAERNQIFQRLEWKSCVFETLLHLKELRIYICPKDVNICRSAKLKKWGLFVTILNLSVGLQKVVHQQKLSKSISNISPNVRDGEVFTLPNNLAYFWPKKALFQRLIIYRHLALLGARYSQF